MDRQPLAGSGPSPSRQLIEKTDACVRQSGYRLAPEAAIEVTRIDGLLAAAVFLESRIPVGCQRVKRFLGRAGIAGYIRIYALVEL